MLSLRMILVEGHFSLSAAWRVDHLSGTGSMLGDHEGLLRLRSWPWAVGGAAGDRPLAMPEPEPEETSLEGTPTWIVASVCSVIVLISLVFERALRRLGKVRNLVPIPKPTFPLPASFRCTVQSRASRWS